MISEKQYIDALYKAGDYFLLGCWGGNTAICLHHKGVVWILAADERKYKNKGKLSNKEASRAVCELLRDGAFRAKVDSILDAH